MVSSLIITGCIQLICTLDNVNSILIATYNIEKELQLHRLKIDFHQAPGKPHAYLPASLLTQHVGIVHSPPASIIQEDGDRRPGDAGPSTSCPQLSFLDIVVFGNKNQDAEQVGPVILATFSSIPLQDQHGPIRSQPYSVVMQWELNKTQIGLHASFGHLTSKRSTSNPVTALPVGLIHLSRLSQASLMRGPSQSQSLGFSTMSR